MTERKHYTIYALNHSTRTGMIQTCQYVSIESAYRGFLKRQKRYGNIGPDDDYTIVVKDGIRPHDFDLLAKYCHD